MFTLPRATYAGVALTLSMMCQAPQAFAQGASMLAMSTKPNDASILTHAPKLEHVATVFIVDAVEPCIAFWVERFGFTAENQVPGSDGKLIFASVKRDGIEVMYQTKASVLADNPAAASELAGRSASLFITVSSIDAAERATAGAPVVKARHKTFYGSTEFYVRDPAGNVIGFAEFQK